MVSAGGRIESVQLGPRTARLSSHQIAERAMAAINAALDAMAASPSAAGALDAELDGHLRQAQDLSLRRLSEYTRSLRDLIGGCYQAIYQVAAPPSFQRTAADHSLR